MNEKARTEYEMFRKIASDEDYKLIVSDKISFEDFERLSFILQNLKLNYLDIFFFEKHYHKFERQYELLEKLNKEYESYIDMFVSENWLKTFTENINDSKKRDYIIELFRL